MQVRYMTNSGVYRDQNKGMAWLPRGRDCTPFNLNSGLHSAPSPAAIFSLGQPVMGPEDWADPSKSEANPTELEQS